jgi:hypothetical protein
MRLVLDTTKLTDIFIVCDDFSKNLFHYCLAYETQKPSAKRLMSESEMMTIVIFYHHSGFKYFKYYYEQIIQKAFSCYLIATRVLFSSCRSLTFPCLSC